MDLLYLSAGFVLMVGISAYLHSVASLHRIIESERPGWLSARRSGSIFYTGMPSIADPNVNIAVVGLAFGSGWQCLSAPQASRYVWRIRLLLPGLLAVFVGVLLAVAAGSP